MHAGATEFVHRPEILLGRRLDQKIVSTERDWGAYGQTLVTRS